MFPQSKNPAKTTGGDTHVLKLASPLPVHTCEVQDVFFRVPSDAVQHRLSRRQLLLLQRLRSKRTGREGGRQGSRERMRRAGSTSACCGSSTAHDQVFLASSIGPNTQGRAAMAYNFDLASPVLCAPNYARARRGKGWGLHHSVPPVTSCLVPDPGPNYGSPQLFSRWRESYPVQRGSSSSFCYSASELPYPVKYVCIVPPESAIRQESYPAQSDVSSSFRHSVREVPCTISRKGHPPADENANVQNDPAMIERAGCWHEGLLHFNG